MCNGRLTEMERVWNGTGTEFKPTATPSPFSRLPITLLPAPDGAGILDRARTNLAHLVLLCYVESTKTSSNFRPQQWQKPIHRSNHGRILLSVCSHVTPEVFFGAQVNDRDE